jgi:hypothetical protein
MPRNAMAHKDNVIKNDFIDKGIDFLTKRPSMLITSLKMVKHR